MGDAGVEASGLVANGDNATGGCTGRRGGDGPVDAAAVGGAITFTVGPVVVVVVVVVAGGTNAAGVGATGGTTGGSVCTGGVANICTDVGGPPAVGTAAGVGAVGCGGFIIAAVMVEATGDGD